MREGERLAGQVIDIPVISGPSEVITGGLHAGKFHNTYEFYAGVNKNGVKGVLALESGDPKFIMGFYESFIGYISAVSTLTINSSENPAYGPYMYVGFSQGAPTTQASQLLIPYYSTFNEAITALNNSIQGSTQYPITYHYANSIVTGPTEAAAGGTVIVTATPDVGYGITDASTQILVTNDDVAVPYTWDATNQRITFTMPEGAVTVHVTASLIPTYPIMYRSTRVTLSGPERAAVDSTVNVDCAFPEGYGIKTTDSITVTCNRVPVPFSWDSENQRITFTMPDPTA